MKRILIILSLFLSTANLAFTQGTYLTQNGDTLVTITKDQLVQTNMIFLEHSALVFTDSLKSLIIKDYERIINNYEQIEETRQSQVVLYSEEMAKNSSQIESLNTTISDMKKKLKVSKYIAIGALSVLIGLILVK